MIPSVGRCCVVRNLCLGQPVSFIIISIIEGSVACQAVVRAVKTGVNSDRLGRLIPYFSRVEQPLNYYNGQAQKDTTYSFKINPFISE